MAQRMLFCARHRLRMVPVTAPCGGHVVVDTVGGTERVVAWCETHKVAMTLAIETAMGGGVMWGTRLHGEWMKHDLRRERALRVWNAWTAVLLCAAQDVLLARLHEVMFQQQETDDYILASAERLIRDRCADDTCVEFDSGGSVYITHAYDAGAQCRAYGLVNAVGGFKKPSWP